MKTLIVFREGLSGHYLKALIDDLPVDIHFRMDPWYPGIYEERKRPIQETDNVCTHHFPDATREQQFNLVLHILADQKIYHAIYNNFFKKFLIEDADPEQYKNWKGNLAWWYDKAFYNIKEYYFLSTLDQENSTCTNIVNFDELLDEQYLEVFFKQYYNRTLSDNMKLIIKQYRNAQLPISLTREGSSMQEIVDPIPDKEFDHSPWFASYCIFKYEINNGLQEDQRLWSIDTVCQAIDKKFLLNLQYQYRR